MAPKVSVIVAAYNAEKYICRCLDSIAAQTLLDWECVIVNDGSKDSTGAIAEEYAARDSRFRVVHQENGGVASARQKGIDNARGEYTIHVDPDDWIELEMFEVLCNKAYQEESDVVICDFITILPNGTQQIWVQRPDSLDPILVLGQMMGELYGSLCNKMIRRSCYEDFGVHFRKDVTVCEDQLVVMTILSHHVKVSYCNKGLYNYDQTQNLSSFVNKETPIDKRLLPLEIISSAMDISPIQDKFDNAIYRIAYHALFVSKLYCPSYPALFRKHKESIMRSDAPLWAKVFILLRLWGIAFPLSQIKKILR